jgi:hypothetical protein
MSKLPGNAGSVGGFSMGTLLNSSIFKGCKRSGILGSKTTDFGMTTAAGISDGFMLPLIVELRFSLDTIAVAAVKKIEVNSDPKLRFSIRKLYAKFKSAEKNKTKTTTA